MAYSNDLGKLEGKTNFVDFINSDVRYHVDGGTTYFLASSADSIVNQHLESLPEANLPSADLMHTYAPASSLEKIHLASNPLFNSFFNSNEVRKQILGNNEEANRILHNECLPDVLDNSYHSLCSLEAEHKMPQITTTYKATSSTDGLKYCLRRLHGCRLQSIKCIQIVDKWKKIQHSNIVRLREVFTTKAFGDNSLILAYDFHPCATNLLNRYFKNTEQFSDVRFKNKGFLPENELWWIIMQVSAAIRAVHQSGLACRNLDPTKIIITSNTRIRLTFLGIPDIVLYDPDCFKVINHYQQDDLTSFGKLIVALATRSLMSVQRDRIQGSLEILSRFYSADLRHLIIYLLSNNSERSISEIMPMIGARFYIQVDAIQTQNDVLENELAKELENSRLYRLIIKLSSINDRPELDFDMSWSETGDRYILKLFRHHLFHCMTEQGKPWLSNAHIVQNLNKLDAGSNEKVQLVSRDEQSVLVVTYLELKNCLERSFQELVDSSIK